MAEKLTKQTGGRESSRNIRRAFIEAGLELFGECGPDGATTRMLAKKAGANISGIAYYFGGKENLYLAVVEHIAGLFSSFTLKTSQKIRRELAKSPDKPKILELTVELFRAMTGHLIGNDQVKYAAKIILQEQTSPTAAFDLLYDGFIKDRIQLLAELIARYTGLTPNSPEAVVIAHALVGQVLAFVVTKGALLKNLGQEQLGPAHLAIIKDVVITNISACLKVWAGVENGTRP